MTSEKTYDNPALQRLMNGNLRYVADQRLHPHSEPERRKALVDGQKPFAAILGCSDSRVPLELIFDQGFGDIFVIRVAGNVANEVTIASVEFAVSVLNVPLVMVMGHSQCGAVSAAISDGEFEGHLQVLINHIRPAVEMIKDQSGDRLETAIRANASRMAHQLEIQSPVISSAIEKGQTRLVSAYYDLSSGIVDVLD